MVIIIGTSSPILGKLFVPNPTPPEISFYNSWSMPLAIIIALATVIGQYLFWEKHDWESLAGSLVMPLILTSIVTILSIVLGDVRDQDRKSTRLNSSHVAISYAVFCSKKKI